MRDLSLADNKLPDPMKAQLIELGLWSMRYSTLAILHNMPVEPLLAVNQNVLDGLLGQNRDHASTPAPAAPFSA